ncbi:hypothetical protein LZ189_24400, partial [Rhodovulum sulfidophilum]|nr:hypothetical protein [Rhodovulum sulfidophilum]
AYASGEDIGNRPIRPGDLRNARDPSRSFSVAAGKKRLHHQADLYRQIGRDPRRLEMGDFRFVLRSRAVSGLFKNTLSTYRI